MAVRDVFQFNTQLQIIQRRQQEDITIYHRSAVNKIFRRINTGRVHIRYFFGKHCLPQVTVPNPTATEIPRICFNSLVNCLQFRLPPSTIFRNVNTKIFRKTINQLNPPSRFLSAIQKQFWLDFWSLALTTIQRNILFRFIHKRIPHKSLLQRLLPTKCTIPICSLCNVVVDSADHFIFTCSPKLAAWQGETREFLWPTVDTQDISNVFSTLNFYSANY